jgi:sec-independent protein translocase protein TatA
MFGNLTGWHALIILAIVILLFGATKLPALARSVGQSMKIFKNEVKSSDDDKKTGAPEDTDDTQSHPKP